jgi:hypothetical protein
MKQVLYGLLALMLVCMAVVSPALAADSKDNVKIIKGGSDNVVSDNDNAKDTTNDESGMDKLVSDDKIFGFEINQNYDVTDDLSLQRGFDLASSLPPWKLLVVFILIMTVLAIVIYIVVVEWNIIKGGKAATNENPQKAAQGIKDSKMVTRAYTAQVLEGGGCIVFVCFCVLLYL